MKAPIHDLHPGNLLTYGSLAVSLAAVAVSGGAGAPAAAGWLALAALLDSFDGRFARCFERTSRRCRVGCEIYSLVDVCAFGMGPVVVLEAVSPPGGGLQAPVWWASGFAYVGAVVTWLGFYNVEADDERFVGLPASAATLVCSTYLVAPDPASPWIVPALFAGWGLAMIAPLAIPRPGAPSLAVFAVWAVSLALWHLR